MEKPVVVKASSPIPEAVPYYGEAPPGLQVPIAQPTRAPPASYVRSETFDDDQQVRVGEWETRLCGCFAHLVPNCLMVTFCPCVSLAQITSRIGFASYKIMLVYFLLVIGVQYAMNGLISYEVYSHNNSTDYAVNDSDAYWWHSSSEDYGTAFRVYNAVACGAEAIVIVFVWLLRTKIRERFAIPGSCCVDCWVSICCSCCAIAQMATHVKSYQPGSCSFGPPDTLPAYPHDHPPMAVPSSYV